MMSAILSDEQENAIARRNAILLAFCQAVNASAAPLSITLGGIVGSYLLGPDKSFATAPVTGFNIGVALMSLPAAMLMRKIGRKKGFMAGAVIGIFAMLLAVYAISNQSFVLFVLALLVAGSSNSFVQQYRFAAADRGTKEFKAKAISFVLVGGIASAIIGPQMILNFRDYLLPIPFAGAFLWASRPVCHFACRHAVPCPRSSAKISRGDCGKTAAPAVRDHDPATLHHCSPLRNFVLCPDVVHDDGRSACNARLRFRH